MVFQLSILARADILTDNSLVQNIAMGINIMGIAFFAGWMVFRKGSHTLENCPARKNQMPYILPLAVFLLWASTSTIIREFIYPAFKFQIQWHNEFARNLTVAILDVILIVIMLFLGYIFFDQKLKGIGLRAKTIPNDIVFGAVHLITVLPIVTIMASFIVYIGQKYGFEWESHPGMDAILQNPQPAMRILLLCHTILIVPLFEELMFRGLLQSMIFSAIQKPWIAIFITSGLFSFLHPPMHWPAIFALSCGMGYAYEKSGSLFRSMLMHAMFNGMNIIFSLLST